MFTLRGRARGPRTVHRLGWCRLKVHSLESRVAPATLLHSLYPDPTGPQPGAQFGTSVATDGLHRVVGAPYSDALEITNAGQAFVYDATTNNIVLTLNNPTPTSNDLFGMSVAVAGKYVVVGAHQDDFGATDSGAAYVFDLTSKNPTSPIATLHNPTPAKSDNFGFSAAISGNILIVGASYDDIGAADAGSAYIFDLGSATPETAIATLNNPTPTTGEQFGYSVAMSENLVVVGSYKDDAGATDAGQVVVYDVSSITPTVPIFTISNPTPNAFDYFGKSVAISANRLVIGAYADDTGGLNSGTAYIFDFTSITPTLPTMLLQNPTPVATDQFGLAVAVSGKFVVIGAQQDDTGATNAGAAYVYDITSTTPTVPFATLQNPSPETEDQFGNAVSVVGNSLYVGTYLDGIALTDTGSVYAYDLSSKLPLTPLTTLKNATLATGDFFGASIAKSGRYVAVGATYDDTEVRDSGSVYVYDFNSNTPTVPFVTIHNPAPSPLDGFGNSASISGRFLVVGAILDDAGANNAGSAYVYDLESPFPNQPIVTLNNPSPGAGDSFGVSVAISGHFVIVGAFDDDTVGNEAGAAYIYDLTSTTPSIPVVTLFSPAPSESDRFGVSVAISNNYAVVGAYTDNTGAPGAGSVYVFEYKSATPTMPVITLNNPMPQNPDNFGISIGLSENMLVVGEWGDNTGAPSAGSAHVYDLNSITPTIPVVSLNNPTPESDDYFGSDVAISGRFVVVGAYSDNTGATNAGSVYVFDLISANPEVPIATINNPAPGDSDLFGISVSVSGSWAMVGAYRDDTVNLDEGAVYVYSLVPSRLANIQLNSGFAQRSMVTSLKVTFDIPVSFIGNPAAAFTLVNQTTSLPVTLAASVDSANRSVTLTFTGGSVNGASLADGRYTLTINANQFAGEGFDGNGDGMAGDDFVLIGSPANGLFRLFGDATGDGLVSAVDFNAFRLAYLGTGMAFDFNIDGVVNAFDLQHFRDRYGVVI